MWPFEEENQMSHNHRDLNDEQLSRHRRSISGALLITPAVIFLLFGPLFDIFFDHPPHIHNPRSVPRTTPPTTSPDTSGRAATRRRKWSDSVWLLLTSRSDLGRWICKEDQRFWLSDPRPSRDPTSTQRKEHATRASARPACDPRLHPAPSATRASARPASTSALTAH
ncbi:hypothetical protein PIB30_050013 [Stylosanthes scabra]|uniref:Uncharacterized protein n=1 Tax=Stylosanthes scabra TaxID=79078 RepID=A0ABU6UJF1_9FABA|nr:hypothetical protein [Stylosanthes scabra]